MSDTPETYEAVERWQQGKINVFDALAELEDQRDQWRECAEWLADSVRFWIGAEKEFVDTGSALAEFDRLKGETK
jgi:hypothetical protein